MTTEAFSQLQNLYKRLHDKIESHHPVCQISGKCCRFQEYGHTLFLSQIEADLLVSEGLPPDSIIDDASCPFQVGNICTAREKRPLGCRVYFCDPSYTGVAEQLTEEFLDELKDLHTLHGQNWNYGPLSQHLQNHKSTSENPNERLF